MWHLPHQVSAEKNDQFIYYSPLYPWQFLDLNMRPCHIKKASTNTSDHSPDKSLRETWIQQALIAVQSKKLSIQTVTQYYEIIKLILSNCIHKTNLLTVQYAFMQQLTSEEKDTLKQWAIQLDEWKWFSQIYFLYEQGVHFLHLKNDDNSLNKNWIKPFLRQHSCLKIKYSNPFDKKQGNA